MWRRLKLPKILHDDNVHPITPSRPFPAHPFLPPRHSASLVYCPSDGRTFCPGMVHILLHVATRLMPLDFPVQSDGNQLLRTATQDTGMNTVFAIPGDHTNCACTPAPSVPLF